MDTKIIYWIRSDWLMAFAARRVVLHERDGRGGVMKMLDHACAGRAARASDEADTHLIKNSRADLPRRASQTRRSLRYHARWEEARRRLPVCDGKGYEREEARLPCFKTHFEQNEIRRLDLLRTLSYCRQQMELFSISKSSLPSCYFCLFGPWMLRFAAE